MCCVRHLSLPASLLSVVSVPLSRSLKSIISDSAAALLVASSSLSLLSLRHCDLTDASSSLSSGSLPLPVLSSSSTCATAAARSSLGTPPLRTRSPPLVPELAVPVGGAIRPAELSRRNECPCFSAGTAGAAACHFCAPSMMFEHPFDLLRTHMQHIEADVSGHGLMWGEGNWAPHRLAEPQECSVGRERRGGRGAPAAAEPMTSAEVLFTSVSLRSSPGLLV